MMLVEQNVPIWCNRALQSLIGYWLDPNPDANLFIMNGRLVYLRGKILRAVVVIIVGIDLLSELKPDHFSIGIAG